MLSYVMTQKPAKDTIKRLIFSEISSTSLWASDNLSQCPVDQWTAITADSQVTGQGQQGSQWDAVKGQSLLLTLVSPVIAWRAVSLFPRQMQAALAILQYMQTQDVPCELKWPNDVMRHGLKMGGMLSQAKWRGYVCTRWIFSVGINVSQAPKAWACMGEAYEVDKVTEALIPLLVKALTQPLPQHEWATYQGHLMGWGQWLQWRDIEKDVLVIAKPVQLDAMGRLQVKTKDGQCQWLQQKQWEWLGEIQP